ncbi:unnamed protein product, partial [Polarella glacialis]
CYFAMELLAEKEQVEARKPFWPMWLNAWRLFLEFFRACTACVLGNHTLSTHSPSMVRNLQDGTESPLASPAPETDVEDELEERFTSLKPSSARLSL